MSDPIIVHATVWHLTASLILGLLAVGAYRWMRSQSPIIADVMAFGIIARLGVGVALFWISYLDLSFLSSLHSGDGFWALAPDARGYYRRATTAYFEGLSTVTGGGGSPTFVKALAAWMRIVGLSPASALFLNVGLYIVLSVLVVRVCRPADTIRSALPCILCLAPFTFAPVLLIHATQPLKDEAFVFLIAVTCLSVLLLLQAPAPSGPRWSGLPLVLACLPALGLATYGMSGIRSYFSLIVLGCLVLAAAVYVWRARRMNLAYAVAISIATLVAASLGYSVERGRSPMTEVQRTVERVPPPPPEDAEQTLLSRVLEPEEEFLEPVEKRLQRARRGFIRSGGETNIVTEPEVDPGVVDPMVTGLALLFVPVSIVKAAGWVDFDGGRGLLFVTDIDTIFLDLSILAAVALLIRQRRSIGQNLPYVCFVLTLGLLSTLLLAYVVTNFGTLFRLRLLMAVPFWMLPLAVAYRGPEPAVEEAAPVAAEGPRPEPRVAVPEAAVAGDGSGRTEVRRCDGAAMGLPPDRRRSDGRPHDAV